MTASACANYMRKRLRSRQRERTGQNHFEHSREQLAQIIRASVNHALYPAE